MGRWLVQLEGDSFDLDELPYWFPSGEIYGLKEDDKYFLTGEHFDAALLPGDVKKMAGEALDEMLGAMKLTGNCLNKPKIVRIQKEDGEGKRESFVVSDCIGIKGRAKVRIATEDSGTETQAQSYVRKARTDPHLLTALLLTSESEPSWQRLYLALEEVERFLGDRVHTKGFSSGAERKRFTYSANSMNVAGLDARHGERAVPSNLKPMTLDDATSFVLRMLRCALETLP